MKNYIIKKVKKKGKTKWQLWSSDGSQKLGEHDSEEGALTQERAIQSRKRAMEALGLEYAEGDIATITDVDVFAVGTWHGQNSPKGGDTYSKDDLQAMLDAYEAGVLKPNLKITHGDDKEQVDIGRLSNLKVKAGKLLADFIDVPKGLYDLMKQGLFKRRSAEVMWDYEHNGKKWPRVLKAVALLAPGQKAAVTALSEGYKFSALYCYELPKEYSPGIQSIINRWGSWAGSFDKCVSRLSGKPGIGDAKRLCAWIHKRAEGKWPAEHSYENYEPTEEQLQAVELVAGGILSYIDELNKHAKEVKRMELEALMKKYGVETVEELDAKIDAEQKKAEADSKKLEQYASKESEFRQRDRVQFIEKAKTDGKLLPRHEDVVKRIFEAVDASEDVHSYELGGNAMQGTVSNMLREFISDLPKVVDLEEQAKKAKDTDVDLEKPKAEVDRLAREFMKAGKADDYNAAVEMVAIEQPELWTEYLKGSH